MKLYTVTEYARHMKISPQAVYKKIGSGKLKTLIEKVDRVRIVVDDNTSESGQVETVDNTNQKSSIEA